LRYYPLLFLLAAVLLAVVFRTVRDVVAALGLVTTCEILVLGLAGYSGMSINFINMVLVPVLFVVALASSIHIHLCYRRLQTLHADSTAALVATYREKAWPVFWAGATTVAGFGSMVVSEAPPVRTLGAWTAFGVALATVASFTLFPCLLATLLPGPASKQPRALLRQLGLAGHAAASFAVSRRRPVIVFFFGVATLALAGTYRLREDTHILRYFEPEDPTKREVERLEALGIGSLYAELIVKSSESRPDSFRGPDLLVRLAARGQTLRNRPEIFDSLGAGDLLQNIAGWTSGGDPAPHGWKEVEDRVRGLPKFGRMYRAFVTDSGRFARLSLQIRALEYGRLEPVLADAIDSVRRAFPGDDVWITGRFPLILATQRHLLRTMGSSLVLTILVILGVLLILLRPGPAFLSAVIVNVWPVVVLVGVMAWFGFPLDSTTIMVASVTLALAVDDTFHTLGYLYRERSSGALGHKVCQTLEKTAPAQVLSSVVLAGGFALCSTSSIVPISQFCFLAGVAIMAALVADLLLFPALLGGRFRQR
jgi:predicted RND superfamily exporter protein